MHPVISAVLIMAFSIAIVGLVVSFGEPILENKKQSLDIENGRTQVNRISDVVNDLADDPVSSSKYAGVNFRSGYIEFNGDEVSFYLSSSNYTRNFDGMEFNKLDINPGNNKIRLTKISAHEIHASLD